MSAGHPHKTQPLDVTIETVDRGVALQCEPSAVRYREAFGSAARPVAYCSPAIVDFVWQQVGPDRDAIEGVSGQLVN